MQDAVDEFTGMTDVGFEQYDGLCRRGGGDDAGGIHSCAELDFIAVADFFLYRPSIEYAVGGVIQIIMLCIRRQCEQKLVEG
jgi:hypothetical protein